MVQEQLSGVVSNLFSGTFALTFWVLAIVLIMSGIGGTIYYFFIYRKKFDVFVKIKSQRAKDYSVFFDYGAILYDKKEKTKYLRLWNLRIDLEVPAFNIFEKTNKGDYVELLRKSEDNFVWLTPAKIDKEYYIKKDGKIHKFLDSKQRELESDIYWILKRKDRNEQIISPQSILFKLLEYTPHIITLAVVFMMLWIILDHLPVVVGAIENAAKAIADSQQPIVVGGG